MKYKMIDGKPVFGKGGHPVVIDGSGKETEFDVIGMITSKLPALNTEAKGHRVDKEKFEAELKTLKDSLGELDIEAAKKALIVVQGLDSKDLINSETASAEREKADSEYKKTIEKMQGEFTEKLNGFSTENDGLKSQITNAAIMNMMNNTEALNGTIFESIPEIAFEVFGKNFKLDGEEIVGYNGSNKLMTSDPNNFNAVAKPDEALKLMIDNHPKSKQMQYVGSGSGSNANPANKVFTGGKISVTREQMSDMTFYDSTMKSAKDNNQQVEIID